MSKLIKILIGFVFFVTPIALVAWLLLHYGFAEFIEQAISAAVAIYIVVWFVCFICHLVGEIVTDMFDN
jgi:hypothetical protein